MKNEMDLMNMDERQRLAWFMANRGTVIAVGAVWIGMIGWELSHGRVPTFMLIMVPVFALFRAGLYRLYSSGSFVEDAAVRDPSFVRYGKWGAALLLVVAMLLPFYSTPGVEANESEARYVWQLALDDIAAVVPLAVTFLWPVAVLLLARLRSRRRLQIALQFAEPVLAVASSIVILWIPQLIFETRTLFFILIIPVQPKPELGCYLAVAANGLYLVSWLTGLLRPWGVQNG
jgi:hypothetical protein